MIKAIFYILAAVFGFQILTKSGIKKLPWFFAGILFFPPAVVLLDSPRISFSRFMVYCLLIATLKNRKWILELKKFPLKYGLLLMLIAYIVIGLFDERLTMSLKFIRPINYFLENIFIVFLTWFYVKNIDDVKYLLNKLIWFFIMFAIYGVLNFVTKQNEYYTIIVNAFGGRNFANDNMAVGIDRFRISSFTWHAIYYGLIIDVILLLELFVFSSKDFKGISRAKHLLFIAILLVNLLLVNSRTPLFALLAGGGIYILFTYDLKSKFKLAISFFLLGLFALSTIPSVSKIFEESISTFSSKGSNLEGSSVEMREMQLAASIVIFQRSPVFGNGFSYIEESLGYSSDESKRKTGNDLMGFESYAYKLLIEQGLIGIISNALFFLLFFTWLIKLYSKSTKNRKMAVMLSFSILLTFLIFIFGTGDLGSFLFVMSFLGIIIKVASLPDNKNNIKPITYEA